MFTYEIVYSAMGAALIQRSDGVFIPQDSRNADFVAFTIWNAAQQVPLSLAPIVIAPPVDPPQVAADKATVAAFVAAPTAPAAAQALAAFIRLKS